METRERAWIGSVMVAIVVEAVRTRGLSSGMRKCNSEFLDFYISGLKLDKPLKK
jgi:hypothetical protein